MNHSKLIVEIDVDASDFSEKDVNQFISEAKAASGINIEVGRPIDDEHQTGPFRIDALSTEYFKVRLISTEDL